MKAITIHQPWATLIALGEKRFETRGWKTNYRGPIAIHAGKQIDMQALLVPEIRNGLLRYGITEWNKMPFGSVIAIANLSRCHAIHIDHTGDAVLMDDEGPVAWLGSGTNEFAFGWYETGRYAWELADVNRIDPAPTKGQQGLWNWINTMEGESHECQ